MFNLTAIARACPYKHFDLPFKTRVTSKGYTREQFSELLKVSRATIQNYENGERSPSADYLIKYYQLFGTNLHWLLTGDGNAHYQELMLSGAQLGSPREEILLHLTRQLDRQSFNHLLDFLMSIQGIPTKHP